MLATSPTAPIRHEEVENTASSPQQTAPEIPQVAICAHPGLGEARNEAPQVAEVYGIVVSAIDSILRKV